MPDVHDAEDGRDDRNDTCTPAKGREDAGDDAVRDADRGDEGEDDGDRHPDAIEPFRVLLVDEYEGHGEEVDAEEEEPDDETLHVELRHADKDTGQDAAGDRRKDVCSDSRNSE